MNIEPIHSVILWDIVKSYFHLFFMYENVCVRLFLCLCMYVCMYVFLWGCMSAANLQSVDVGTIGEIRPNTHDGEPQHRRVSAPLRVRLHFVLRVAHLTVGCAPVCWWAL